MIKSMKTKTAALATVGVLCLGGGAYAATSGNAPTPLTGTITDKASDAALAKYPGGTLVGIQSRADGTYEAEVRQADGTEVHVSLDKDFKVTATHTGGRGFGGPGHGGPGGPGRGFGTAALAKALGVTEEKLEAAQEKVRPAKPDRTSAGRDAPDADRTARRDAMAAALAKELNLDAAKVKAALEAQRPAGRP